MIGRIPGRSSALPRPPPRDPRPRPHPRFAKTGAARIRGIPQQLGDRGRVPAPAFARGDLAGREPPRDFAQTHPFLRIRRKHLTHHRRLGLLHDIDGVGVIRLLHIPIPIRGARQRVHDAALRLVAFAAPRPFHNVRPFVFRDQALHLHEQAIFGRVARRGLQIHHRHAAPSEFLGQQDLIRVFATEAIRGVHQHGRDLTGGGQIPHGL